MPRIIFKCPYIKPGTENAAAHLGNYVRYVATRDGTELLTPDKASQPATKKQRAMVERLLKDFPMTRELFEYEDYQSSPTRGAASEFITRAIEDNYALIAKRENYVSYIAQRPRVERIGAHGLFNGTGDALELSRIAEKVANHSGNVWLPIISLRREDAARLGYDNAKQWQALLSTYATEIAEAMKIPWKDFRWYAAFHDEGTHPHVHMVCYSADGRSGFLDKDGIARIKSGLAKNIFRQELTEIYRQQIQRRDELVEKSGEIMRELIQQMRSGTMDSPRMEQLTGELSQRLKKTSGKKQYGYLKAPLKAVVDEIVDELAKDPRVAAAYDLWYRLREEVLRTYKDDLPQRVPLSRQKEFKRIKNIVIEEAVRLGRYTEVFSPEDAQEPAEPVMEPDTIPADAPDMPEPVDETPPVIQWSARYKLARSFLFGTEDTPRDAARAFDLLREEALAGNALAMHDLGSLLAGGAGVEADTEQSHAWYAKALAAFQTVEQQRPDRYVEYRIGKMYAGGLGTEQDDTAAAEWFSKAANRGHQYAQYALAKLYSQGKGVPQDDGKALMWFQRSAAQGNPYAKYQAAKRILSDPAAAPEQRDQAVDWLTEAAEAELDYAQYALGKLYRDGGPVEQDALQAAVWFTEAAEQNNQHAMYALGKLHREAGDPAKALRWFQRSAELGNQFAQYRLGKLLLSGEGIPKDAAGAVRWLTEAAEQGNQYAQYALGKLYLLGQNVSQDRDAATRWFTQAAVQGNGYARYFLDHMDDAPSLFSSATRLLRHMGRIFQEQAPPPAGGISFVDSKLRRKIREKKIAMGHKPDDHEEQTQQLR
mgnify:CR=1 FL=1